MAQGTEEPAIARWNFSARAHHSKLKSPRAQSPRANDRIVSARSRLLDNLDAVQQLAGFLGREHGCLALFDDVLGAAHGVGRVHVEHVAGHKPVEQHSQGGQVLLHRGRGEFGLQLLHEGGDMDGQHVGGLADTQEIRVLF